jgi:hypothetical protein
LPRHLYMIVLSQAGRAGIGGMVVSSGESAAGMPDLWSKKTSSSFPSTVLDILSIGAPWITFVVGKIGLCKYNRVCSCLDPSASGESWVLTVLT